MIARCSSQKLCRSSLDSERPMRNMVKGIWVAQGNLKRSQLIYARKASFEIARSRSLVNELIGTGFSVNHEVAAVIVRGVVLRIDFSGSDASVDSELVYRTEIARSHYSCAGRVRQSVYWRRGWTLDLLRCGGSLTRPRSKTTRLRRVSQRAEGDVGLPGTVGSSDSSTGVWNRRIL